MIASITCRLGNDNVFGAAMLIGFCFFFARAEIPPVFAKVSTVAFGGVKVRFSPLSPFHSITLKLSASSLSSVREVKALGFCGPVDGIVGRYRRLNLRG